MTTFNERIPLDRLIYCYTKREEFCKTYFSKEKDVAKRKQWETQFTKFLISAITEDGNRTVHYEMPETAIESHGSRLYANGGIQSVPADIRGFLCRGYTTDVDAKNCHPKILKYICDKNSIPCEHLTYYINNRDYLLTNNFRTKEEGKKVILVSMNSSDPVKTKIQFVKQFDAEMKQIQSALYALPEYATLVDSIPENKRGNALGSLLNRICCSEENKMLSHVEKFFKQKRIDTFAKCFDGILVYGTFYDDNQLLGELEEYVEQQITGLKLQFAYKEHSSVIPDIPTDWVCPQKGAIFKHPEYMKWKAEFEQHWCKIISKSAYLDTTTLQWKDERNLIVGEKHRRYEKKDKNGDIKNVAFINEWVIDSSMRTYDDIGVFPNPADCPPNVFNMWVPFPFEDKPITSDDPEYDAESVEKFLNHIRVLVGEKDVSDYFINYVAHLFQKPHEKPSTCMWLVSNQGAGKSIIIEILKLLISPDRVLVSSSPERDVWGQFNNLLAPAFLVALEEVDKRNMLQADGKLKSLLSESTITISEKGRPSYTIPSVHRYIGLSNTKDPVFTSEDDRRNMIIRCLDVLKGNRVYFDDLLNTFIHKSDRQQNALRSLYWYLKTQVDISAWDFRAIPRTKHHQEIIKSSRLPLEEFLIQLALQNRSLPSVEKLSKDVLADYNAWCILNGVNHNMSSRKLMADIKLKCGIQVDEVGHTRDGTKYAIIIPSIIQKYSLQNITIIPEEDEKNDL